MGVLPGRVACGLFTLVWLRRGTRTRDQAQSGQAAPTSNLGKAGERLCQARERDKSTAEEEEEEEAR